MDAYHTRAIALVGTGGTASLPPSRLAGVKSHLDGTTGGTVTVASLGEIHGPYSGGTTFARANEPLVAGDCVITGNPGDRVVLYFAFD